MNAFLEKVKKACQELEKENGKFSLLAFVELAANQHEWDIVVCADWLPKRQRAAIDIMADKLEKFLDEDDFLTLSRVIILNKEDSFYCELKKLVKENTPFMSNVIIDGLDVKQIHILQFQVDETVKSTKEQFLKNLLSLKKLLQDDPYLLDDKALLKNHPELSYLKDNPEFLNLFLSNDKKVTQNDITTLNNLSSIN
jgi:hypothetical protein